MIGKKIRWLGFSFFSFAFLICIAEGFASASELPSKVLVTDVITFEDEVFEDQNGNPNLNKSVAKILGTKVLDPQGKALCTGDDCFGFMNLETATMNDQGTSRKALLPDGRHGFYLIQS